MIDIHQVALSSPSLSVVVAHDGGMPRLAHLGTGIDGFESDLLGQPVANAALDVPIEIGILPELATGFPGRPGVEGMRPDGSGWAPKFTLQHIDGPDVDGDTSSATFELADDVAELGLVLRLTVDDVLTISAELHNLGTTSYNVTRLAPSIPLPPHAEELLTFTGRWCKEFVPERTAFGRTTLIENRTGRTSHHHIPGVFAGSAGFTEQTGEVWGVQLAWSGNYAIASERLPDGRRHVQAGELLAPGEVLVDPGASYRAPDVVVSWSPAGLTTASQRFHRAVRRRSPSHGPRPVILNTWEAVYFDHRLDTLQRLADVAAEVGVERFVLDDGWFGGRRDDTAGLGDWWVSDAVWPTGLGPIVDHVTDLGMQFGLWVEPEMVNPDSELYRTHPEWTLTTHGYEPLLGRNQLVLDVGRPEVRDFLFTSIDALLNEYDISYLKWDMNRDVVQGSRDGRAAAHGHARGVYELIDRLRAAHPAVEIESCASGGGRIDLGILRRADRVWTSDCNDAVERQAIQRGFSMLFPPEVMGSHIGPERAHTTRRRQGLAFRASTALFGHLGIEWNLLQADDRERARVAAAVRLHQQWRDVLHAGDAVRVDHPDRAALVHGVVDTDRRRALFAYVQVDTSVSTVPAPVRFAGLDPDLQYRVRVLEDIAPLRDAGRARPAWMTDMTRHVSGRQLIERGVQLPVVHPETVVLLAVEVAS